MHLASLTSPSLRLASLVAVFRDRFTGVFDVMAKKIEDVEVCLGLRKDEEEEEDDDDDFDFD